MHLQNPTTKRNTYLKNGQRTWIQVILQRYTNTSKALEKKLNIISHYRNANQNNNEIPFHILLGWLSVQFSHSVVSDSLQPHESQHARPPCPSPTPGVHSDSRPSNQWCHPAISSSVPFSSCPQSLPASGSFPVSQLFTWSANVLEFQLQHQSFQWTLKTELL